jgi:hypothetical protein
MWKDPVWSKVISTGIIAGIAFLITYFAGWLPTFLTYVQTSWDWLFQSTSISHWVLIIISIPCLLVFLVVLLWIKSLMSSEESFESYTCDTFFGLKWRWSYLYQGKISTDEVHSFCSRCDHQIFPQNASAYQMAPLYKYDCPDCNHTIGTTEDNFDQLRHKVILKVQKNIRNGQWHKNA